MTMQDLYDKMKDVLQALGVRYYDMGLVKCEIRSEGLFFSYDGQTYSIAEKQSLELR